MLSKRLAIAFMLIKGYDYVTINKLLKVSDSTIWGIKLQLIAGGTGYKKTIKHIMGKEKWEKFWGDVAFSLEQAMPPKRGSNWKEERRKQWKRKWDREKPF